jgi:uncharacterized protein
MAGGMLGRVMSRITPRSDNYFKLFNELAALVVRGAKVLATMSSVRSQEDFDRLFDQIKRTEGEADTVTRTILLSLHKTFITPFDRWEIKDLAMALDDMIDCMEDIPQRTVLYGPGTFTPEMAALGQIALRGTERIAEAVKLLSDMNNAPRIIAICQEIGDIESDADHVMRAGMTRLFSEVSDARALIRAKELYELFEEAVDRCQDAADVIHGVVLERI